MQATQQSQSPADVIADNVRVRTLELLSDTEPLRRHEIADKLDVSEASVSRATQKLIGAGLLDESDEGNLVINPSAKQGISYLDSAIDDR